MPSRRSTVFVLVLVALVLTGTPSRAEEGRGRRELALGRESAARQDHAAAARHFQAALSSFDPAGEREALADTWLELGLTSLNGLDDPRAALTAFLTSAALAKEPSTAWLWASVAAEKLGRTEEAATYKTRALQRPAPAAPAPEPAPPVAEPEPPPAPEPVREEPAAQVPPAETDAVQHFFGSEAAERKPARKKERAKRERKQEEPSAPAAADEPKETVDAVQYFFGEKEPAAETAPDTAAEEKPPAEM